MLAPRSRQLLQALGVPYYRVREAQAAEAPTSAKALSYVGADLVPAQTGSPQEGLLIETNDTNTAWSQLEQKVKLCQQCVLAQSRTQTVFGSGSRHAKLMLIGEAPGMNEDKQGLPFVGRAGQLLTQMLLAIGLSRDDVYIANMLKCRPPNNRDPKPEEIASCSDYLQQQVALVQPKLIVTLGRIAAQGLLGVTTPLGRLRGQQHRYADGVTPMIVTYHPAYLLRNPADKRKAMQDLIAIQTFLTTP